MSDSGKKSFFYIESVFILFMLWPEYDDRYHGISYTLNEEAGRFQLLGFGEPENTNASDKTSVYFNASEMIDSHEDSGDGDVSDFAEDDGNLSSCHFIVAIFRSYSKFLPLYSRR